MNSAVDKSTEDTIPAIAKRFKARAEPWALVVDENYGEGSAREHAAMQPRHLGCLLIVARSFARIHETNLKVRMMLYGHAHYQSAADSSSDAMIEARHLAFMAR